MRYSLHSRFRGTIIGAVVGEMLSSSTVTTLKSYLPATEKQQTEQSNRRIVVPLAQSLIRLGRFDLADWRNACGNNALANQLAVSGRAAIEQQCVWIEVIIVTIILSLFYHENEIKLRQNLQLALTAMGQDDSVSRDGALVVGYAIAQSLKEKFNATDLIAQTIAWLNQPQSLMSQQLAQVQILLEQGTGLERTVAELLGTSQACAPVALAFYCYLSTLEDFRLAVSRAAQQSSQLEISSMITGALSGAYNSLSGIPALLRLALSRHQTNTLAAWGITTEIEMLELTDSLVAVWSGMYDQAGYKTEIIPIAAIAAPGTIR